MKLVIYTPKIEPNTKQKEYVLEYESKEKLIKDFENKLWEKQEERMKFFSLIKDDTASTSIIPPLNKFIFSNTIFKFCSFSRDNLDNVEIYIPNIYTWDEWFEYCRDDILDKV